MNNECHCLRKYSNVIEKHNSTPLLQGQIKKDLSSGIVRLKNDKVYWDLDNKNIFEVDMNDVVVIGEYTNSYGPYFDDLFLTFVTKDGQWHSIPWYADSLEDVTQYLSNRFHQNLNTTHLANSTAWKSIIRYPLHLEDKELFTLTPSENYKAPKTFFNKILSSIGFRDFDTTQNIGLTEEVINEVKNANR